MSRIVKNISMEIKIKEIRKTKNITLGQLSKLSGMSKSSISNYERGEVYPNIQQLEWIARALKVKITDLFESDVK